MSIGTTRQGFDDGHNATARPENVSDEYLEYLDELRESGATNMFGARPYLMSEFPLTDEQAATVLGYWMKSFGDPNR